MNFQSNSMEGIRQLLSDRALRINRTASGWVYDPGENLDYLYVLTAKHCLVDKNVNIERLPYQDIVVEYFDVNEEFNQLRTIDAFCCREGGDDFAIIILQKDSAPESILGFSPPFANNLPRDAEFYIPGFPKAFANKTWDFLLASLKDQRANKIFLQSKTPLVDGSGRPAINNVSGYSGSGIVTISQNQPFLVGIFTQLRNPSGTFNLCIGFQNLTILNDVLSREGYAEIRPVDVNLEAASIVLEAIHRQSVSQLEKQLRSRKYLRNTFLEISELKDNLRGFSDPVFFFDKIAEETSNFDFRHLNRILSQEGQSPFLFNMESLLNSTEAFDTKLKNTVEFIDAKVGEIESLQIPNYKKHGFTGKLERKKRQLESLGSGRVRLITEDAGQGKTNLMCDLVDRLILPKGIPCVFLTGQDLDPSNVEQSFLNSIWRNDEVRSLNETFELLRPFCNNNKQKFLIIIDGINETTDSGSLLSTLKSFIADVLQYEFVRIILTCRSEYYIHNFKALEEASFHNEMSRMHGLSHHLKKYEQEKLVKIYLKEFKVHLQGYSEDVLEQLGNDFLLLRIFSEAHEGQTLAYLENIYLDDLFELYYTKKNEEVKRRSSSDPHNTFFFNFDFRNFCSSIIQRMIQLGKFTNIPLLDLLSEGRRNEQRRLLAQFLDENILFRRDLPPNINMADPFGQDEVVNFTFDQFRDYLISVHLTRVFYKEPERFVEFMDQHLSDHSPILEGVSTFLFHRSKKPENRSLYEAIKSQDWFHIAFIRCIFQVKEEYISDEDLVEVENLFKNFHEYAIPIAKNLVFRRWDSTLYPKLNIQLLLRALRELDDSKLETHFTKLFDPRISYTGSPITKITTQLDGFLTQSTTEDFPYHNLFEFLLYLLGSNESDSVESLYEKYSYRFRSIAQGQVATALTMKSEKLKFKILRYRDRYDL